MAELYLSTMTFFNLHFSLLTLCSLLRHASVLVEQTKHTSQKTALPEKPVEITTEVCLKR